MTKKVFCAECQVDTDHEAILNANHDEIVFTCSACARAIKFPILSADEIESLLVKHREDNSGKVVLTPQDVAELDTKKAAAEDLLGKLCG